MNRLPLILSVLFICYGYMLSFLRDSLFFVLVSCVILFCIFILCHKKKLFRSLAAIAIFLLLVMSANQLIPSALVSIKIQNQTSNPISIYVFDEDFQICSSSILSQQEERKVLLARVESSQEKLQRFMLVLQGQDTLFSDFIELPIDDESKIVISKQKN